MPPREKGYSVASANAKGPHAGQASIRKAYEALGVQHFYATHGARYTNPHEAQIFAAIAQLLETIPAEVWLGMRELEPVAAEAEGDSDDEAGEDDIGTDPDCCQQRNTFLAQIPDRECRRGGLIDDHCFSEDKASTSGDVTASERIEAGSADFKATRQGGTGAVPGRAAAASLAAMASSELMPPVPLRVLDLACGSGEATAAIMDWNLRHPVIERLSELPVAAAATAMVAPASVNKAATTVASAASTIGAHTKSAYKQTVVKEGRQQQQQQSHGFTQHCRHPGAAAGLLTAPVLPYELHITACDPYTGAAYLQRTGCTAIQWSFEDIADGCLADWDPKMAGSCGAVVPPASAAGIAATALVPHQEPAYCCYPHFDLVICSFALHLCDPSRLHGTCTALSIAARWLAVLAPHKRPVLGPELGWQLVSAWRAERTHLRLYRSQRVPAGAT
ncbi:hypothetical protein Vafri_19760 [Volvox africanus]|uniref:Methyltransferase domain-containing protein n=1 Tax=Volvox africanus TaxID=51714 RepID=A0A8J4BR66_9CHLO|nr:hypothetical protein Vafri_19760 [Volvox africanus]